jgi:2-polyprenyl-3-methyl-5-hydroxy-6-metoxy-1,4-benzoquinol methylase
MRRCFEVKLRAHHSFQREENRVRSSHNLEIPLGTEYASISTWDKVEIDNPDQYHPKRLNYLDRLNKIISVVRQAFPIPNRVNIGDFACAQANVGLILAELGYKVFAFDINLTFLEYSMMKHEEGEIEWVHSSVENVPLLTDALDIAIAGELIEHCAYPEDIVDEIYRCVRPGGLVVLTTPNGARVKNELPTFTELRSRKERAAFEGQQFLPDGKGHLFLFRLEELPLIVSEEAEIVERGYLGGTFLINKYSRLFLCLLPVQLVKQIVRFLAKVPVVNRKTFNNVYVVLRKRPIG